jgi:three-Cys-motif partner protein
LNAFFDESTEQSQIKATIVSKYFWAWAKVIMPTAAKTRERKIAYLDLFAGPGRYKDGSKSTPILILEQAVADPNMREMLVTVFNDKDEKHHRDLERSIAGIQGIETLRYKPVVLNEEVGEHMVKHFESEKLVPTLFFVDPWGYKGLSLKLVNSVLKNWGCDCIFFFNYNRINMGLSNPIITEHMNALFGPIRANELRSELESLNPEERELTIVEDICNALDAGKNRYVLPFRFRNDKGTRTSHHLIFVSKHFRGYEIMKGVMAKESSTRDQGVPSFEYSPADERFQLLFELSRPLDELEDTLIRVFAGKRLTMRKIYEDHNVGTPYIERNYKEALIKLESRAQITCDPAAAKRRKGTIGPETIVQFPPYRGSHVA